MPPGASIPRIGKELLAPTGVACGRWRRVMMRRRFQPLPPGKPARVVSWVWDTGSRAVLSCLRALQPHSSDEGHSFRAAALGEPVPCGARIARGAPGPDRPGGKAAQSPGASPECCAGLRFPPASQTWEGPSARLINEPPLQKQQR